MGQSAFCYDCGAMTLGNDASRHVMMTVALMRRLLNPTLRVVIFVATKVELDGNSKNDEDSEATISSGC
eukprot:2041011-Rhodomonas_salina.1